MHQLVTVVIPTYNRADYLVQALESVFRQTYPNLEIIVVDDGSSDNTAAVAARYGSRIRYIRQDNNGPSSARNNGIRNAAGKFIAFLDSDDLWQPGIVAAQVKAFEKNPSSGLVTTAYGVINDESELTHTIIMDESDLKCVRNKQIYKNFFATSAVMVKKECFEKLGYFNEHLNFAEDWDMWLRIIQQYDVSYLPEVQMLYRVHPVKITSTSVDRNLNDWITVIQTHSNGQSFFKNFFLKKKRLSWLHVNHAWTQRGHNLRLERLYMIRSILSWPLWMPGRYSALFKTLRRSQKTC